MTVARSLDHLLEPSAAGFSDHVPGRSQPIFLALALASWVIAEALMAPVLQPLIPWLWLAYLVCFFLFTAWYFRVSRLLDSPWRSYRQGLSPLIWALTPLHVLLPMALLSRPLGGWGILAYEIAKAGVLLAVVSRMVNVFQDLNSWPRWSALVLTLSPLGMAFVGVIAMVSLGGVALVALGLNALHH